MKRRRGFTPSPTLVLSFPSVCLSGRLYLRIVGWEQEDDNNKSEGGLQEIRILSFYDEEVEEEASLSSYCGWMTMV